MALSTGLVSLQDQRGQLRDELQRQGHLIQGMHDACKNNMDSLRRLLEEADAKQTSQLEDAVTQIERRLQGNEGSVKTIAEAHSQEGSFVRLYRTYKRIWPG